MKTRTRVVGAAASLGLALALVGCGGDGSPASPAPASPSAPAGPGSSPTATSTTTGSDASGLSGITFPPGAVVTPLGTDQKQYAVTGMTLDEVKSFFENQMIAAGYIRAQEASASRFYDKGRQRIQITWSDQQGTIRGVVRVTRS